MSSNQVTLFYLLRGDSANCASAVRLDGTDTVDDLRSIIKERRRNTLAGVDAVDLVLWKVHVPEADIDDLQPDDDPVTLGWEQLSSFQTIEDVFPTKPDDRHVHVIVTTVVTQTDSFLSGRYEKPSIPFLFFT